MFHLKDIILLLTQLTKMICVMDIFAVNQAKLTVAVNPAN